jgi:hypothetical protein
MQISIERGVKNGKKYINIKKVGNPGFPPLHMLSTDITGETTTSGDGIFTKMHFKTFVYGEFLKTFEFNEIDMQTTPYPVLIKELRARAKAVREWIATIDYSEKTQFDI